MSALNRRYGDGCVAFINGDGRADEVVTAGGEKRSFSEDRGSAADRFNSAKVRFLVSTEAAGEGIDLQKSCYTLIHVDLPWNPMRLHQRVGRLYRYGQQRRVEVLTLRNPDTVESRIWEKLNTKIDQIMLALGQVMDEPEDLLELVLGMTSPKLFREVFAESHDVPLRTLSSWFDQKTARFGGQDVLDTVRSLVGHCARFDFQEMSDRIPKLDLPALRPFFLAMLSLNNRRPQETETGLSFKTPENWLNSPAARTTCRDMRFSREAGTVGDVENVLGVGHVLFDEAVIQARGLEAQVAGIPATVLSEPLIVFRITEQVTSHDATIRSVLAGVQSDETGQVHVLQDWELLDRINRLLEKRTLRRDPAVANATEANKLLPQIDEARRQVQQRLAALDVYFVVPDIQLFAVLCPVKGDNPNLEEPVE